VNLHISATYLGHINICFQLGLHGTSINSHGNIEQKGAPAHPCKKLGFANPFERGAEAPEGVYNLQKA
jgi:hypothetical protein